MLKRISLLFFAVMAFGTLFGLVSVTCSAQNTRDHSDKARDLLDEYERRPVDYGVSEHDAMHKWQILCDKYGDLISDALEIVRQEEHYNCHMDPQCKKNAKEKYEQIKIPIFDALKKLCAIKLAAIRRHYDKDHRDENTDSDDIKREKERRKREQEKRVEWAINQPSKPITRIIKIVAKSYIALIGPTHVGIFLNPAHNANLFSLALLTDGHFNENPLTDDEDGKYRLYSSRTYRVTCDAGKIINVQPSEIETDTGLEIIPRYPPFALKPPPLEIKDEVLRKTSPSTYSFTWTGLGRPNLAAEPAFQAVSPRTSVYIWHTVEGQFDCSSSWQPNRIKFGDRPSVPQIIVNATITGSRFPSHRLFIDGRLKSTIPQGFYSFLWEPYSPAEPWRVR